MRIIIECPESASPLRGRIHLRRLSLRPTSNLWQFGGGPYIECNGDVTPVEINGWRPASGRDCNGVTETRVVDTGVQFVACAVDQ